MIHFRSLLSLGAIEDDDDEHLLKPFELHRMRSQQLSKSTRLSQRKKQNIQRLESSTISRPSFTMIKDGKKVKIIQPPLQHSYSTKITRKQFFYPKNKNKTKNINDQQQQQPSATISVTSLNEQQSYDTMYNTDDDDVSFIHFEHMELELSRDESVHLQLPTNDDHSNNIYINQSPSPLSSQYITPIITTSTSPTAIPPAATDIATATAITTPVPNNYIHHIDTPQTNTTSGSNTCNTYNTYTPSIIYINTNANRIINAHTPNPNTNTNSNTSITPFFEYVHKMQNQANNLNKPQLTSTLPAPQRPVITNVIDINRHISPLPPYNPPYNPRNYVNTCSPLTNATVFTSSSHTQSQPQSQSRSRSHTNPANAINPQLNNMLPPPKKILINPNYTQSTAKPLPSPVINNTLSPPNTQMHSPLPSISTDVHNSKSNTLMSLPLPQLPQLPQQKYLNINNCLSHSNHSNTSNLGLRPQNSIASIQSIRSSLSDSIPPRISLLTLSTTTQNRTQSILSPIIQSPDKKPNGNIGMDIPPLTRIDSPHLNKIMQDAVTLTDTDDDDDDDDTPVLPIGNSHYATYSHVGTPSANDKDNDFWHINEDLYHHNSQSPQAPQPNSIPPTPTSVSLSSPIPNHTPIPRLATIISQQKILTPTNTCNNSSNSDGVASFNQSLSKETTKFIIYHTNACGNISNTTGTGDNIFEIGPLLKAPQLSNTSNTLDPLSSQRTSLTLTTNMTNGTSARTSQTLSFGLPNYSPNDSPHSTISSGPDFIDELNKKKYINNNSNISNKIHINNGILVINNDHNHNNNDNDDEFDNIIQMEPANNGNIASKIYREMLSPPNTSVTTTSVKPFNIMDDDDDDGHVSVSDSDDTDYDDYIPASGTNGLTLYNQSRESEIFLIDKNLNDIDMDDDMDLNMDNNDYMLSMQPLPLSMQPNSNEIDLNISHSHNIDDNDNDNQMEMICDYNYDDMKSKSISSTIDDDSDIIFSPATNTLILNKFPSSDFIFMNQIGRGAYGVVAKQFHLKSCQIVAIKRSRSPKKDMMKSFKKEIKICNEFKSCPYIINMIECGTDKKKNEICIALEYMNMGSLMNKTYYTLTEIKHIAKSVLNALAVLHDQLYVHNDIKPDNILINNNGDVKLTDFGCIKQMKNINIPLIKPIGSITYQSYEKRFISPIKYTTKSDIYSLGITITELLNGTHCNLKEEQNENKPYNIPTKIINKYKNINYNLIDFLNKCLDKNYNNRWSAKQLLNHSFLQSSLSPDLSGSGNKIVFTSKKNKLQRTEDLEFMTDTLINYYLNYNKSRRTSKISNNNNPNNNFYKPRNSKIYLSNLSKTPIDDQYNDAVRLENIAKNTGYSIEAIQEYIFQSVNDVKNKYLTR